MIIQEPSIPVLLKGGGIGSCTGLHPDLGVEPDEAGAHGAGAHLRQAAAGTARAIHSGLVRC
jgi:hypothetical protein